MDITELIRGVELFQGLTEEELDKIALICKEREYSRGDYFTQEGEPGTNFCVINQGIMSIKLRAGSQRGSQTMVRLGRGQIVGEMSLVDKGSRSATVQVLQTPTRVVEITHKDFHTLCKAVPRIGYVVMRNIAADLSFKLRHSSRELRERQ